MWQTARNGIQLLFYLILDEYENVQNDGKGLSTMFKACCDDIEQAYLEASYYMSMTSYCRWEALRAKVLSLKLYSKHVTSCEMNRAG